jgi:signal transduction histidine kinase
VPLFAGLAPDALAAVVGGGQLRHVATDDILFRQGDVADCLYVVLSGALRVWVTETSGEVVDLATVGPGGYVGEIALLDGGPRSASVACAQTAELFTLERSAFLRLMQSSPELLSQVFETLTRTVRTSTERLVQERMEQRAIKAEMELARHRALTEMVAGVAHEINTPLGIVRTAASLIQSRLAAGTTEDLAEASALIERNIERAHRLVEDFKTLSVSQVSDTLEQLDLLQVVREIVELFSINARKAGLRVVVVDRLTPADARTTWHGYRGRLSQVVLNLLTNVERYAYPNGGGGNVEIEVAPDVQDGFVLSVRDHGRGIPETDLARVFDPFFTTGRARGGTGLGLAIVRNLVVDGLGGRVEIASTLGAGTTVTVHLPAAAPLPQA